MRDLTLAAACVETHLGDGDYNLARLSEAAVLAVDQGADLVLFPEACLTGYGVGPEALEAGEDLDGKLTGRASQLAGDLGLAVVAGLIERNGRDTAHLTQITFDRHGRRRGIYRKVHLGPTETDRFRGGADNGIVDLAGARVGLQLCYDGHYPELAAAQAREGAEIIALGHASPGETPETKRDRWLRYLSARAYDNTTFLAACNLVGDNGQGLEFCAVALILGPKGEILAQYTGHGPGLAVAPLPAAYLERIRNSRMGFFRAHRRPELYAAWRGKAARPGKVE